MHALGWIFCASEHLPVFLTQQEGDHLEVRKRTTVISGIQLTDGSVLMRLLQTSDILPSYEAVSESIVEISPWMDWCHPDYSMEEAANWVNSCVKAWTEGTEYQFAITDVKDGAFLGGCGLNGIDPQHRWANLGYWVRSSQTRRGVATAATLLVARFGFNELKLNRIEIVAAVRNAAVFGLLKR